VDLFGSRRPVGSEIPLLILVDTGF
jgi:hypothetical protein